jgi:molecular chaperone GrpE
MFPAPDESMKGKIIDCTQKGYLFHDKVIRYAKVVVAE